MKRTNFNLAMVVQWIVFMPLLLATAMISGAVEGIKRTFDQAKIDILDLDITQNN